MPDDEELHKLAESGDAHLASLSRPVNNRAFNFGSAETAPDGNVYLMRRQIPLSYMAFLPAVKSSKDLSSIRVTRVSSSWSLYTFSVLVLPSSLTMIGPATNWSKSLTSTENR